MKEKNIIHSSFWSNLFSLKKNGMETEDFLAEIPPFIGLSKKDIHILSNFLHYRNYLAGEYIFYQGDPGIGIYLINEGEVEIQRTDEFGNVFVLAALAKKDFFGELALIDGEKRSASAVALTDCSLSVLFKPDLDEYIQKYPKKGIKILQGFTFILTSRLRKLNEDYFQIKRELNRENFHGTEYKEGAGTN